MIRLFLEIIELSQHFCDSSVGEDSKQFGIWSEISV